MADALGDAPRLSERDRAVLRCLAEYKVLKVLAVTRFSRTVLLELRASGERHVAKLCDTSGVMEHTRSLIMQEAELLRRLSHPNIIRYVSSRQVQEYVVIITEYANLGDLQRQIEFAREQRGTPQERQFLNMTIVTSIFGQVCRGLQYIHSQNVVHRDIKPANIFLMKRPGSTKVEAKIADFGISRYLSTDEHATTIIGSAIYAAPEVLRQEPYNRACDLWSLGVVLHEMVQLELPLCAKLDNIIKKDAELPPPAITAPGAFRDLKLAVEGLLRVRPEERLVEEQVLALPHVQKVLAAIDRLE